MSCVPTATQVEEYGAQPPLELLRQWMDHGGWYDRKELTLRKLQDIQFVAAMGPPGGGRNAVTNRYLRHYSVVSVTAFDTDNLRWAPAGPRPRRRKHALLHFLSCSELILVPRSACWYDVRDLGSPCLHQEDLHLCRYCWRVVREPHVRYPSLLCSTIFTALVDWYMKKFNYTGAAVARLAKPLVAASLEVYDLVQRELLPTPTKSHYTFNLRDVSKVFQVRTLRTALACSPVPLTYPTPLCLVHT